MSQLRQEHEDSSYYDYLTDTSFLFTKDIALPLGSVNMSDAERSLSQQLNEMFKETSRRSSE